MGFRYWRDRQWSRNRGCNGSDAHPECFACAAAPHNSRWLVDRRRGRRVWLLRIREAAFWIRAAFGRARSVKSAGFLAEAWGSTAGETRAAENFGIFQPRQWLGKNSRRLFAGECLGWSDLPAVDRPFAGPRREHLDDEEYGRDRPRSVRLSRGARISVYPGHARLRLHPTPLLHGSPHCAEAPG